MKDYTLEELQAILEKAKDCASKRALLYFNDALHGQDTGTCGYAWVRIFDIKGNSKMGRKLKQLGLDQDSSRAFVLWMPGRAPCQSMAPHEAGASAAAEILKDYGFTAYACSRVD